MDNIHDKRIIFWHNGDKSIIRGKLMIFWHDGLKCKLKCLVSAETITG